MTFAFIFGNNRDKLVANGKPQGSKRKVEAYRGNDILEAIGKMQTETYVSFR